MILRVGLLTLFATASAAQLNLLSPREAIRIIRMIPEVAEAQKAGSCPRFEAGYGDSVDRLGVQVRNGCGPYAGQLVNRYEIDLSTGAVFQQETSAPIRNPEGEMLATSMLKDARARLLSGQEARCLALEAAKSLPGWSGQGSDVSVERFGAFSSRFRARLRMQDPSMITERFLTVDRSTGHVRDEETGMEVLAPSLTTLVSKMLSLHLPSLLSEMDALDIARQIPEVKAQASKPCSVFHVGGSLSWEVIYIAVQSHCEGALDSTELLVAVNPQTGDVADPNGRGLSRSAAAVRAAHERLDALESERVAIRKFLTAACRPQ
jgi:hypothetical protein